MCMWLPEMGECNWGAGFFKECVLYVAGKRQLHVNCTVAMEAVQEIFRHAYVARGGMRKESGMGEGKRNFIAHGGLARNAGYNAASEDGARF